MIGGVMGIRSACAAAVCAAVLAFPGAAAPPPMPAPEAVAEAAERTLARGGYQSELPAPRPPEAPDLQLRMPEPMIWLVRLILFGGGAVVVFLIVRAIVEQIGGPRAPRKAKLAEEAAPARVSAVEREAELDPEALAAAGEFAAAIRVLFARALVLAARTLAVETPPSDTAREALKRLDAGGDLGSHLLALARKVEASVFAEEGADRADYDAAKARLDSLRAAAGGARA
jgi:hypothetical protein